MATELLTLTDVAPPPTPETRRTLALAWVTVRAEQTRQGRRTLDHFGSSCRLAFYRGATLDDVAEAAGLLDGAAL